MQIKKIPRVGSRRQVFNGNARQTPGGLKKHNLKKNKWGRIVSLRLSNLAKKQKRLVKAGFTTKKGTFGFIRTGNAAKKTKKRGKKKRKRSRTKSRRSKSRTKSRRTKSRRTKSRTKRRR